MNEVGLPQVLAFIASVFGLLFVGIYAATRPKAVAGSSRVHAIFLCFGVWALFVSFAWGFAGYSSGQSFLASALAPLELVIRVFPALLKAL